MYKILIALVLMIFNSFGSLYAMERKKDMEREIWEACREKNIQQIKFLIEQDTALANTHNYYDQIWYKASILHWASRIDNAEIVAFLLNHDANVNARGIHYETPLHNASEWGDTNAVALLLQHNADVNAHDNTKWTPLHFASMWRRTKIIPLLLSYGATPHKPINLFVKYPRYSQTYAQRYESWICKTFVSRKTITRLLSLIGRKKIADTPLLPKDICNLIANYAISDQEREREESSQNPNYIDPVLEWEQFKKDNPDVAALARIELP